jgi:hypothetical protein
MRRSSERGSANVKFLIVMVMLGATAYAAYLYVPVAYNAKAYTDLMQHYGPEYGVPPDAVITCVLKDSRMEIHVQFVREIEFPGYTYNYEFDRTVKSTAFLSFK